jgi:hypothetical protein
MAFSLRVSGRFVPSRIVPMFDADSWLGIVLAAITENSRVSHGHRIT